MRFDPGVGLGVQLAVLVTGAKDFTSGLFWCLYGELDSRAAQFGLKKLSWSIIQPSPTANVLKLLLKLDLEVPALLIGPPPDALDICWHDPEEHSGITHFDPTIGLPGAHIEIMGNNPGAGLKLAQQAWSQP